jgi:ABC-type antimicrobial peptide transport system permease subunit
MIILQTMRASSSVRTLSALLSTVLAIAAVCIPLTIYESLEGALDRWLGSQAETIRVDLLSPGTMAQLSEMSQQSIEGLQLFRPVALEYSAPSHSAGSMHLPMLTGTQINAIESLPVIESLAWELGYTNPVVTSAGRFSIRLVPPQYFDLAGFQASEGRLPTINDTRDVIVLGSEVRQKLFGDRQAVDQHITLGDQVISGSLTVIGVLAPTSLATVHWRNTRIT